MKQGIKLNVPIMEGFMSRVLLPTIASPRETPPFHRQCWAKAVSDHPQVVIAAPRSHAKSTAVTYAVSLASALFRTDPYIVVVSRTYSLATEFIRSIKIALETNQKLRRIFEVDKLTKDTENDFICRMKDGYEFRLEALGFGGSVRGLNWNTQRPTLIILDDVEDDEAVMSPERREKGMNWMLQALIPAMDPVRNRVRVVGTFLHIDAMLVNLVNDDSWDSLVFEAHNDDYSEILWPQMFNKEKLLQIRSRYEGQGRFDLYNMEYRNRVIDTSSGYFRKNEFQPFTEAMRRRDFRSSLLWWAGGDFAWSLKQKRDYTVLPVVATDYQNNMYVFDVVRGRFDATETVEKMFEIQETWNPGVWFNERGAIYNSLTAAIDMRQRESGTFLNTVEMAAIKEKRVRARPFQARMRAKTVFWDTEAEWFPEVQQELLEFDRGKHDDCVDALAHIALGLSKEITPSSPDDIERADYEQMEREVAEVGGRNRRTGY